VAIELPGKNRDEGTEKVITRLLSTIQRLVQIKMERDELMGTETFATRVKGDKCLDVHQRWWWDHEEGAQRLFSLVCE
jgi:hypothetical protein